MTTQLNKRRDVVNIVVYGERSKRGVFAASSYAHGGGKAIYRDPEELCTAIRSMLKEGVDIDLFNT